MTQEINLLKVPFFGTELLLVEHNRQAALCRNETSRRRIGVRLERSI